jgi:ectoine hydroxylase-related dioxygenase (phytanoyl-CoA dioxygenase family)
MTIETAALTPEQLQQYAADGFFVARGLASRAAADAIRREILRCVLDRPADLAVVLDRELDAMAADRPDALYRKLSRLGRQSRVIWEHYYASPRVLPFVRHFLGEEIYLKYDSVFLKPAKTGGATPWHQDIGLWRDINTDAFNAWMAVDAATRENGCLQVVPGSHRMGVIPHVKYPDGVHGELPRRLVERTIAERGVRHIELQPGDVVFWHSHLWHSSPPNQSDQGRIGMGAVWISPEQAHQVKMREYVRVMTAGRPEPFPPEPVQIEAGLPMTVNEHLKLEDIL